jgi:hypothetical protein
MNMLMWRTNNRAIRYCDYPDELLDHFVLALQNCVQMFRNTIAKYDGTEQSWGQGDSNIRTLLETTFKSWNRFHEFKLDENKPLFICLNKHIQSQRMKRTNLSQTSSWKLICVVCLSQTNLWQTSLWSTTHYCAISDHSWEILGTSTYVSYVPMKNLWGRQYMLV